MFRKTSAQTSLLENQFLLPPAKRARLERSWARGFRERVLPLIDEELFRGSFHKSQGRPNKSIRLVVGLLIIKEMADYTDTEAIDALEFNLQVQYALGVEARTAHVCQKTLHNHRKLLMEEDRAQTMFERITKGLAELDGLSLGRQRLDSTHVMSNIAVLTRLGLFVQTVTAFLKELRRALPEKLDLLDAQYVKRYLEREGYFSDAKRHQARRRLRAVASDLYRLMKAFEHDKAVAALTSHQTLARLFEEQCELVQSTGSSSRAVAVPRPDEREAAGASDDHAAVLGEEDAPIESTDTSSTLVTPALQSESESEEAAGEAEEVEAESEEAAGEAEEAETEPKVRLLQGKEISASSLQSPHDPDATYGHKGKGYEAQVSETCEADNPYQVITGVSLNGANESDQGAVLGMVDQLNSSGLGPEEMVADTGYGSGENIVGCAERGVDLQAPVQDPNAAPKKDRLGEPVQPTVLREEESEEDSKEGSDTTPPAPSSPEDQDRPLGLEDFSYDKTYSEVQRCPGGQAPTARTTDKSGKTVWNRFSAEACTGCALAERCPTRLRKDGVRTLRYRRSKAATACRQREQRSAEFKERYKIRSGIESTNAELKGRHGARRFRVRGRKRMNLSMHLKATAVNAKRASEHHAALARASEQEQASPALRMETHEDAPTAPAVTTPPGVPEELQTTPPPELEPPSAGCVHRASSPPATPSPPHQRPPGILRGLQRRLTEALERGSRHFDKLLPPLLQGTRAGL